MLDICKSCEVFNEVNDDGLCVDCNKSTSETLPDNIVEELADAHIESIPACDCCETTTHNLVLYNTMNMCPECYKKELALEEENASHADERVAEVKSKTLQLKVKDEETDLDTSESVQKYIKENKLQIDTTIETKEDFFNANTLSIIEMKAQIEQDHSIKRKHFALSERLSAQFKHLRERIFKRQEENVKDTSMMRSIQQFLNENANKLRADEREKIKLEDINYKPSAPKKAKTPKIKKPKFDKKELKKYSDLLGGGIEYTLQGLCVSYHLRPEQTYKYMLAMKDPLIVAMNKENRDKHLAGILKKLQAEI